MAGVPSTSITLLKAISSGADSVRWAEFFEKYESPMRGFLQTKFPSVDQDDAIQDTMVALMKALPDYHYTPDANGHFRNYLMGILSHKAADILRKSAKQASIRERLRSSHLAEPQAHGCRRVEADEDEEWQAAAMEAAVEQLMSNPRINPATREVFRHVALMHEKPEDVARQFGISRNNVDQIKSRMIGKLAEMIRAMTAGVSAP